MAALWHRCRMNRYVWIAAFALLVLVLALALAPIIVPPETTRDPVGQTEP